MIENCLQDFNIELNFNKEPCCLNHLLIMNRISEEYFLSYEFGKFLLKIMKNIFEKEKNIIKNNAKLNSDYIYKDLILMISKHISHFYLISKIKFAKYLCKIIFNFYNKQEYSNKKKLKDIISFKNNLSCIYHKEKRYDKAFNIIKDTFDSNNNNSNNNDYLIFLNNYINLFIKSKKKITKEFINKINLLKTIIKQKISQISRIHENNISNKHLSQNTYTISEIQLYLFINYNYCKIYSNFDNNHSKDLSNYKKGYELSMHYLGEKHHLTLKYKIIINKTSFKKINIKKGYKYKNHSSLTKLQINSKIEEINNRLEKIGKSISPVKKFISNYKKEEKKYPKKINNHNLRKNKSKIEIYAEDVSKNEYSNKNYFDNNYLRNNSIENELNNNSDEDKNSKIKNNDDIPKLVINLNNDNNDELICTTLYQEASSYETEEKKENNNYIPKIEINLNNDNNDDLICTTLYQEASNNENEEKKDNEYKKNLPKVMINLDSHNNDDLICTTLYQEVQNNENEKNENENKNNIPKVMINLDNHNNDELECVTLFQQAPGFEKENKNEFGIEKEIDNKIDNINNNNNLPKINLCLDQSNNDDYTCETFFISADEEKKGENTNDNQNKKLKFYLDDSKKEETNKNSNKFKFTFNIIKDEENQVSIPTNKFEEKNYATKNINDKTKNEEILKNYFIDIKFYRIVEIKTNQKEEIFDISKFINEIKYKKAYNNEDKCDYKIRILDKKKYILKLEMFSNDSVKIILIDKDNSNELFSSKYSYNKILNLYKIIRHDLCLNNMQSYYNFNSYDEFIAKTFLNFITINKEKDSFKFKMAKKPLGLCYCNIVIQLHFCKCIFDIIVISKNYCKIIFSSENDDFNSLSIETFFDEESFNMLIDTEILDNNKYVYSFKNNDLNNNEPLMELIKKLQKCINSYCSGIINVFDDIYPKTNPNQKKLKEIYIFKLTINNKLNDVKLYICEFGNRLCKVVSVDQNLVKLKGIIYSCEINDLFGYETGEIWIKLFTFQKVIFGQLILNSIFYNESNSRICINKYELVDEFNFVKDLRVSNFSLIKLNDKVSYIKFTVYMSVGTWEYTKLIFINSNNKNININNIKLKNFKKKLIDELNIVEESINKGEDSFFTYLNID